MESETSSDNTVGNHAIMPPNESDNHNHDVEEGIFALQDSSSDPGVTLIQEDDEETYCSEFPAFLAAPLVESLDFPTGKQEEEEKHEEEEEEETKKKEWNTTPSTLSAEDLQAKRLVDPDQDLLNVVLVRSAAASAAARASRIQQVASMVTNYCKQEVHQEEDRSLDVVESQQEQEQQSQLAAEQESQLLHDWADSGLPATTLSSSRSLVSSYDNRGRAITKNLPSMLNTSLGAIRVEGPGSGYFDNNTTTSSAHCVLAAESSDEDNYGAASASANSASTGSDHHHHHHHHHQDNQSSDGDDSERDNQKIGHTKILIGGAIFLVLAAVMIIVIVVIFLTAGNDSNGITSSGDDLLPWKEVPLEEKEDLPPGLIMSDLPDSTLKAISEFRTPQAIAYDWLANDPYLSNYTDWRRKQRFALATFAFTSTFSSRNYFSVASAMDWYPLHECEWFSTFKDSCTNQGHLTKLKLRVGGSYPMSDLHLSLELLTPEMSSLVNLQTVDSKDRSFVTTANRNPDDLGFPTSLLQMTNLRYLKINNPGFNKGMVGTLPAQLVTKLSLLEHLDLSFNSFSGPIPSQYGLLEKLQVLRLSHNHLDGTIPMNWGQNNLGNLTVLDVSSNPDLVAEVPIGFCLNDGGGGPELEYFKTDWCDSKLECCGEV